MVLCSPFLGCCAPVHPYVPSDAGPYCPPGSLLPNGIMSTSSSDDCPHDVSCPRGIAWGEFPAFGKRNDDEWKTPKGKEIFRG